MEIRYFGANCVKIKKKKASIIVDDTKDKGAYITTAKDIAIQTNKALSYGEGAVFEIQSPGEYEVSEVAVTGIASTLHHDPDKQSVIYSLHIDGFSVAIIGHTEAQLDEAKLEKLGVVDVLIIPVGGHGYTLDAVEATKLIKEIEPKIVIPTHYEDSSVTYEMPQAPLEEFLKTYGASDTETLDVLKLKDAMFPEKTQLVILNKQ